MSQNCQNDVKKMWDYEGYALNLLFLIGPDYESIEMTLADPHSGLAGTGRIFSILSIARIEMDFRHRVGQVLRRQKLHN